MSQRRSADPDFRLDKKCSPLSTVKNLKLPQAVASQPKAIYKAAPLLWELASVFGIPRESLVTSHAIWERMVGQHDDDWSFIVQHLDDIPAASTDCLVILDVEVHFPLMPGTLPPLPATTRRVLRIPPYITRPLVLQYAGVHQYCAVQRDRCLVYIDNRGWPILQPGPQRVRHGNYFVGRHASGLDW